MKNSRRSYGALAIAVETSTTQIPSGDEPESAPHGHEGT